MPQPVDATPTGAVEAFVEAIDGSHDARARERAYRLLCPAAQIALAERARSVVALGGRSFEPWEMIVEGRSRVRRRPRRSGAFRERAVAGDPDRRLVDVIDEAGEVRSVPVERVDGSWCVAIEIPPPDPG